jgi:hypothetical protein
LASQQYLTVIPSSLFLNFCIFAPLPLGTKHPLSEGEMIATTAHNQDASLIQVQRDKGIRQAHPMPHGTPGGVPYYKALIQIPTLRMWYLIVKCHSPLIQQTELAVAALSLCFHPLIKTHQTFIKSLIIYRISILAPKASSTPANLL